MLTALLMTVALANPAAENLPRFRTSTAIVEVTPVLDWYDIDFHEVEAASCEVGVNEATEIVVSRCQYPPGFYGESTPARSIGALVRAFRKQNRGARNIRVGYLRRGRQVRVEDVVPIEGNVAGDAAIFEHGERLFSLVDDELTPLRLSGGGTGLYCYRDDCSDHYWLPDVTPESLEGTSILANVGFPDSPDAYEQAAAAMAPVIVEHVAAMDRGEERSWPTDEANAGFPQHGGFAIAWSPRIYARPSPQVAGSERRPPDGFAPTFLIPLNDALNSVVDQTQTDDATGLVVRAQMDLSRNWARVDMTLGSTTVWQEFRIEAEIHDENGNPWWKKVTDWRETERYPVRPMPGTSLQSVSIESSGDVLHYELFVQAPERSRRVLPESL